MWADMSDAGSTSTRAVRCGHCAEVIERQPAHAAFCPFCGYRLGRVSIRVRLARVRGGLVRAFVARMPRGVRRELEKAIPLVPPAQDRSFPSLVVLGYSSALYHLGWRYEHAVGCHRNLDEARRCYDKSARLGYIAKAGTAAERLTTEGTESSEQREEKPDLKSII